jgi:putative intracellular protease/amidase
VAVVISHKDYWYPDYAEVTRLLRNEGAQILVASSEPGDATAPRSGTGSGPPVRVDLTVEDLEANDLTAIVVCGGPGYREFTGDAPAAMAVRRLLTKQLANERFVMGICDGVNVLAEAEVLQGLKATTLEANGANVNKHGGKYVSYHGAIRSGYVITARTAQNAKEFVEELVRGLP